MDATAAEIRRLQADAPQLRLLRHLRSCGQSAALRTGVRGARAAWIATLDGDGQNDPADIAKLWHIRLSVSEPLAMCSIAGCRKDRQDSWTKRAASRIANSVRRWLLSDGTPDTGCGLKLFPRSLFLDLPYFDHMHRFLPALVLREGGVVQSVPVNHRPRREGVSKYGIFDRLWVGAVDLFGSDLAETSCRSTASSGRGAAGGASRSEFSLILGCAMTWKPERLRTRFRFWRRLVRLGS